jgi:two-component system capsular synthesis sensor histidine kinase RcsC
MASGTHAGLRTVDGRPPRIALVDGNPTSTMLLSVLCEAFGCWPLPVATAEAALALIRRDDLLDLVVVDLALPDMDGIVVVQLIRALGRDFPILGVASKRSDISPVRTRAAGLNAVLIKPFSPTELYDAIALALGKAGIAALVN